MGLPAAILEPCVQAAEDSLELRQLRAAAFDAGAPEVAAAEAEASQRATENLQRVADLPTPEETQAKATAILAAKIPARPAASIQALPEIALTVYLNARPVRGRDADTCVDGDCFVQVTKSEVEKQLGVVDYRLKMYAEGKGQVVAQLRKVLLTGELPEAIYINTNKAPFNNLALRKAVAADIDRDTIVNQIYGSYGHPAGSPYAPGILDQSLAPIAYPTSTVKGPSTPITFAYSADESGIQGRLAQLIQQKLTAQGFQVSIKEVQLPQVYAYANDLSHAPDLLLMTNTPDAAHPDTWARILWGSTGGLNFLGYSNKQVDTLLDQGASSVDKSRSDQSYGQAGQLLVADYGTLFIADTRDVMVMRKNLTGVEHVPNYPWALKLAALKRS